MAKSASPDPSSRLRRTKTFEVPKAQGHMRYASMPMTIRAVKLAPCSETSFHGMTWILSHESGFPRFHVVVGVVSVFAAMTLPMMSCEGAVVPSSHVNFAIVH